ncbi:50S ribosomal protein L11 methyltransferase, partial [bacterium]|nr:50S ribosomal protein L11 methyltransferase [bacterium]
RRIEVLQGHVQQLPPAWPKKYDMILANIQKSVILEILDTIRSFLSHDGVLLVSGILTLEDESMRQAFTNRGLHLIESKQDGEWVAYVLQHDYV